MHAGCVEPIFEAVLANDPSRITAAAAAQRMAEDLFVAELPHMLYQGDTPLHLAAAGLRYDAASALLVAGAPVNAVNRRGAAPLHYACDPRPQSPTWDPATQRRIIELLVSAGAAVDQTDRGGVTPLHRAVRARSPAAVAALLSAGANPARRPGRKARPRCTSRSHRPARAAPPEPASSSSRSSGCSSPPARPWPTWTTTASPSPTGSRARPCAAR